MSIVFYDTETTGRNASFDQIIQFAAIRTDADLNELERFEIRSRLSPHVIASPGAVRVNRATVNRLNDPQLPSHYEMVRAINEKLDSWCPSVFVGYNSLEFDERFLRHAFYKTLHAPYLTNSDGNCRTDILKVMQAATLFAPNSFVFPINEENKTTLKLEKLAPANGFKQHNAHDAMGDVEATIHLLRLVRERCPELWSNFMRFSQKASVAAFLNDESVLCFSDFYFGNPFSCLATVLGVNPDYASEIYLYDLRNDPSDFRRLTDVQLRRAIARSPKPIRRIRINASPILAPADEAPAIALASGVSHLEAARRADALQRDENLKSRLIAAVRESQKQREASSHVEMQLYDGFFKDADKERMVAFHLVPWPERLEIISSFDDPRLRQIGTQLIYLEQPQLLDAETRAAHDAHFANRLCCDEGEGWTTLPSAIREAEKIIRDAVQHEADFIREHLTFLQTTLAHWRSRLPAI